ncbi:MAG TPA: hypothetical protein VK158_02045 [Acidobacteriota bacterium]|nr:hypothetical protein [Acidobacteriota bacterium]
MMTAKEQEIALLASKLLNTGVARSGMQARSMAEEMILGASKAKPVAKPMYGQYGQSQTQKPKATAQDLIDTVENVPPAHIEKLNILEKQYLTLLTEVSGLKEFVLRQQQLINELQDEVISLKTKTPTVVNDINTPVVSEESETPRPTSAPVATPAVTAEPAYVQGLDDKDANKPLKDVMDDDFIVDK